MRQTIDFDKLDPDLQDALIGRGLTRHDIEHSTQERLLEEWAGWHLGDPAWGRQFLRMQRNLVAAEYLTEPELWQIINAQGPN